MLELSESPNMAEQIISTLKDKTILNVHMLTSPHKFLFTHGDDPMAYDNLLSGKTITSARPNGGQVEVWAEDIRIVFTDGANIKYFHTGEKLPKKHQMQIEFTDGSSLITSILMYGGIFAFKEGNIDYSYYHASKDKPSPYSNEFDFAYFEKLLSDTPPKYSAKAFLATEQRIPGLGNGVLQDILFNAGINPQSKISALKDEEIENIFPVMKTTLLDMASHGGRDTEKDLFNVSGGYKTKLSNKTFNNPCPVCGSEIIRKAYMGGNVYFCPVCQPIKK